MFIHRLSDIAEEPRKMLLPIEGHETVPVVSLDEAIEPLGLIFPSIKTKAYIAKYNCEALTTTLTLDQSAAIMLYTMSSSWDNKAFYAVLNSVLRSDKPGRYEQLKPWFLYLKLFITGLACIPSYRGTVYRGVKLDLSEYYTVGKKFVWWGFSSCAKTIEALQTEIYFGTKGIGTVFIIECFSGKEIREYSYYEREDQVLLVAGRQFEVVSRLNPVPHLWIIQVRETESRFPFFKLDSTIPFNMESINDHHKSNGTTHDTSTSIDRALNTTKPDENGMKADPFENIISPPKSPFRDGTVSDFINMNIDECIPQVNQSDAIAQQTPYNFDLVNSKAPGTARKSQSFENNHSQVSDDLLSRSFQDQTSNLDQQSEVMQTKKLKFQNMLITTDTAMKIAENIRQNALLEILYFANNELTDDGLAYILEAISDRSLLKLFVIDNKITDISAMRIAVLLSNDPQIMSQVHLNKNKITSHGVKSIIRVLPRDSKFGLKTLSVSGNPLITDECIDDVINVIEENRSLKCLYLEKCNLSVEGKERLRRLTAENPCFSIQV